MKNKNDLENTKLKMISKQIPVLTYYGYNKATTTQLNQKKHNRYNMQEVYPTSMDWAPTTKEAKAQPGKKPNIILDKIDSAVTKLYWTYIVHLPFFIMTPDDGFLLHLFFLSIFSVSLFGIIKYCFL